MSRVIVVNHVTLDGVMQSPSRIDEDRRGGFGHGGRAVPYGDEVMGRVMGERMAAGAGGAMLFGRFTYGKMAAFWPQQIDGPRGRGISSCSAAAGWCSPCWPRT